MHVLLRMCELRPYVEWQGCTFEGTDLALKKGLAHLEATATLRSPNTRKIALKVNFPRFFLYLCIFFCTFVANSL